MLRVCDVCTQTCSTEKDTGPDADELVVRDELDADLDDRRDDRRADPDQEAHDPARQPLPPNPLANTRTQQTCNPARQTRKQKVSEARNSK